MILRGKAATECMSSLYTVMEHLKIRRHRSFFFADMGMSCKKPCNAFLSPDHILETLLYSNKHAI